MFWGGGGGGGGGWCLITFRRSTWSNNDTIGPGHDDSLKQSEFCPVSLITELINAAQTSQSVQWSKSTWSLIGHVDFHWEKRQCGGTLIPGARARQILNNSSVNWRLNCLPGKWRFTGKRSYAIVTKPTYTLFIRRRGSSGKRWTLM